MSDTRDKFARVFVVALVLVSTVAAGIPIASTSAAATPPSGFVGVPDSNVSVDVPEHARGQMPNRSELEGSVMATAHSNTLDVTISTEARARGRQIKCNTPAANKTEQCSDPELALVLSDTVNHAGRKVAVPISAVKDALGYVPGMAYGLHESGERWRSPITSTGSMLIFEVPHFSTNTVTFSSKVSVTGSYSDGSTVSYDVSSLDSVSNFSANVTGETSTEWDNQSATGVSPGGSVSLSVAGNTQPNGPASGEPRVTVTPKRVTVSDSNSLGSGTDSATAGPIDSVYKVYVEIHESTDSGTQTTVDYEITDSGGTVLATDSITIDGTGQYEDGNTEYVTIDKDVTDGSDITVSLTSNTANHQVTSINVYSRYPSGVSVSTSSDSATVSSGTLSSSSSVPLDIQTSDTSLTTSFTDGEADVNVELKERTQTVDPSLSVNGHSTSYSGTLADGSTASLTTNDSWIESGTNSVNVSVGDGTLSADAPAPSVALNYTHEAEDKQSVDYTAEKWRESYNISKTFASDRSSASVTIPFDGSVFEIVSIEKQVNGGGWSTVQSGDYSLKDTTLTVQLGSVVAGDTVDVRTTGHKIQSINSEITVTKPTTMGNRLDTKFRVDSWSSDAKLSLGGTPDGGRIHYVYNASWAEDEFARITSNGYHYLHLPNVAAGGEARISTIPVRINAESGEVRVSVPTDSPSRTEPEFSVQPGSSTGDTVDFTFIDAKDGEKYELVSTTTGMSRGSATANSPITITDDDSDEDLKFTLVDTTSVSGDSGSDKPLGTGQGAITVDNSLFIVFVAALLAAIWWLSREFGSGEVISTRTLFFAEAGLIGILAVETASPLSLVAGVIRAATGLGEGLGRAAPLAIIGVVILGYLYLRNRGKPSKVVNFRLGRGDSK